MKHQKLGSSGLEVPPFVFGGNVFGWTIDEKASHDLLDRMVGNGLCAIDTADVYSAWVDGNKGGESETIIGNWLHGSPERREKILLFTKVGMQMPDGKGLSRKWILEEVENSLRRLQTDYVDLYFSHRFDEDTPQEETLAAYQRLIDEGKVRAIGASNFSADQLRQALDLAEANELAEYTVLQPEYNLYDRKSFEGPLQKLCLDRNIGVVSYFSLASGFLSGKYRDKEDLAKHKRGSRVEKYLDDRGQRIVDVLREVASANNASPAETALAWTRVQKGITAPIVSATSRSQLDSILKAAKLELSEEDIAKLNDASAE